MDHKSYLEHSVTALSGVIEHHLQREASIRAEIPELLEKEDDILEADPTGASAEAIAIRAQIDELVVLADGLQHRVNGHEKDANYPSLTVQLNQLKEDLRNAQ